MGTIGRQCCGLVQISIACGVSGPCIAVDYKSMSCTDPKVVKVVMQVLSKGVIMEDGKKLELVDIMKGHTTPENKERDNEVSCAYLVETKTHGIGFLNTHMYETVDEGNLINNYVQHPDTWSDVH
jgi:hypothetical protein